MNSLKITDALLLSLSYFAVMLAYTLLDIAVWRKAFPKYSDWLNAASITLCASAFLYILNRKGFHASFPGNVTLTGFTAALACSVLFYFLLDKFLDPIIARAFPTSEQLFQDSAAALAKSPVTGFIQTCIIAPFVEEILMRGIITDGLKTTCGIPAAILLSALLFALLHFNMVQTLSAFICGIVLGLLYVKTGSVLCCITAHCGYNMLSYFMILHNNKPG